MQKVINKDREETKLKEIKRNQFILKFERVRVCATCYFIYKNLEKVYFKEFFDEQKNYKNNKKE